MTLIMKFTYSLWYLKDTEVYRWMSTNVLPQMEKYHLPRFPPILIFRVMVNCEVKTFFLILTSNIIFQVCFYNISTILKSSHTFSSVSFPFKNSFYIIKFLKHAFCFARGFLTIYWYSDYKSLRGIMSCFKNRRPYVLK